MVTGPLFFIDTSSSDSALVHELTVTDLVTALAAIRVNNTDCICVACAGSTNDVFTFTDLDDIAGSDTELFAMSAGDWLNAVASLGPAGIPFNVYVGKIGGVNGIWETKHSEASGTTPRPCSLTAGSTTPNPSNASVTTSAKSPTTVFTANTNTGLNNDWTTPANILASDDAYATFPSESGVEELSDAITAGGFGFNIPTGSIIKGVSVGIECKESQAADDASFGTVAGAGVSLMNGSTTLATKTSTTEFATTDEVRTFGSSTDPWAALTASDINNLGVKMVVGFDTPSGTGTVSIDHVTVTVTYIPPGVGASSTNPIAIPIGGYSPGPMPSNPSRLPVVAPVRDETGSVLLPRKLHFVDFSYTADGDRIVAAVTTPNTTLAYVEGIANGLGGNVVIGDNNSAGIATKLLLIRSDGEVLDLRAPTTYNGKDCGIANVAVQGRFVIYDLAFADATDVQTMYYFDGRHYASTLPQDLSSAISTLPVAWSNWDVSQGNRRLYRLYPVSTTHLAAARQFIPPDLLADPITTNTSEAKYEGSAYVITPQINLFGPVEANKTLNVISYQGTQVSSVGGAFGSVRCDVDTGGDFTVASGEATSGVVTAELFDVNVTASGIALRRTIFKLTANNTGASSKTPNLLPWTFTGTAGFPDVRVYQIFLDITENGELNLGQGGIRDPETFLDDLLTKKNSKAVQKLRIGKKELPAELKTPSFPLESSETGLPSKFVSGGNPPYLVFVCKPGSA